MVWRSYVLNSRINPFKIEMINDHMRRAIFQRDIFETSEDVVLQSLKSIEKMGLVVKDNPNLKEVDLKLPKLCGDIKSHFYKIANDQSAPYKRLCNFFKSAELPSLPSNWKLDSGWTQYDKDKSIKIDYPDDEALIFDVEVCINDPGDQPTLAVAVSSKYWYSWCNPLLVNKGFSWQSIPTVDTLIPLEGSNTNIERVLIGHNVGYDRSWLKEQYNIKKSKLRFIDTMSLHLCCSGLTHLQRASKMAKDRQQNTSLDDDGEVTELNDDVTTSGGFLGDVGGDWEGLGSLNNLADIHALYRSHKTGYRIDQDDERTRIVDGVLVNYGAQKNKKRGGKKKTGVGDDGIGSGVERGDHGPAIDLFLKGTLTDVRANFQRCMTYCAYDCFATHQVFQVLVPMFFERFPHPVTFAGMLEMGTTYLPTKRSAWDRYLDSSESTYRSLDHVTRLALAHLADEACALADGSKYKDDPWLWDLDWGTQPYKLNKKKTVTKSPRSPTKSSSPTIPDPSINIGTSLPETSPASQILRDRSNRLTSLIDTLSAHGGTSEIETGTIGSGSKLFEAHDSLHGDTDGNLVDMIRQRRPTSTAPNQVEVDTNKGTEQSLLQRALASVDRLPKVRTFMPGYPAWYRDLCIRPPSHTSATTPPGGEQMSQKSGDRPTDRSSTTEVPSKLSLIANGNESTEWRPGPYLVNSQARVAPKLLRLTWDGYPLYFHPKYKWGYLVPGNARNLAHGDAPLEEDQGSSFPLKNLPSYENLKRPVSVLAPDSKEHPETSEPANGQKISSAGPASDDQMQALWSGLLETSYEGNLDDLNQKFAKFMRTCRSRDKIAAKADSASKQGFPNAQQDGGYNLDTGEGCQDVPGCWFYPLPHKQGPSHKVGNPLSKDFVSRMEDGTLSACSGAQADKVLANSKMISYWKNARLRILSQLVVYFPPSLDQAPERHSAGEVYYGAILPKVVVCGTVSRRAVEPTWLTASNARDDRLGSELKAMIQAPPGYSFVGADVDSQELWIAALLGDSNLARVHGCTAFGWMTLQGTKQDKTDMHSKTATLIGTTRDQGKVLNYARIYGAGQRFATRILMQFNHRLTRAEATKKAKEMFLATKGKKVEQKTGDDGQLTKKVWYGGSESHMFNELEDIATSARPTTPFLGSRICRTLEPDNVHNNFMTSRTNWVVQSSAVDFLHLMLVCMKWLFDKFDISGRYCISIHDEVRYIVEDGDKYRAALALQITNLMTRSFFSYQLGMYDLPLSVAFFSSIDVDKCLRKEVDMDCKTPSNPDGLELGYGIPKGEALDIHQIIEKTGGHLDLNNVPEDRDNDNRAVEL